MKFYWLVFGVLTVWTITHFLQAEDGLWEIVIRIRQFLGAGFWGKFLDCFYCLSVWVSAPIAYLAGQSWPERALLWPSFSAPAMLLEGVAKPAPGPFAEDPVKE